MKRTLFYLSVFLGIAFMSNSAAADDYAGQTSANNSSDKISLSDYIDSSDNTATVIATESGRKEETQSENSGWFNGLWKGRNSAEQAQAMQVKRSNASVFDIAGVMLRMNSKQVTETLQKRGYRLINASLEIPNFIRWRYEEQCRNKNVVGYERLQSCVVTLAKKNNYQYAEHMIFSNFATKETINVTFTSNFTGNKAYIIEYRSEATNVKGSGSKATYLRNLKIYDFWNKINQKYGVPDNKEQVTWGLGGNKPSLHADTGYLILKDPMLLDLDQSRMLRENQKFLNSSLYTF